QHGDEPAPTEAMLKLIQDLAFSSSDETADLLSKVSFFIIPMMNPDGAERNTRRNSRGIDLNRDWLGLSQPETRCVRRAIDAVEPHIILDAHELSPGNNRGDFVETVGLASGAGDEVVSVCLRLQELIMDMLRIHDIHASSYRIEDRNPARLAHRYFPIHRNTASILLETRQSGIRQYQLDYRKSLHITSVMTVAKFLAGQEDRLRERIAQYDSSRRLVQLASRKSRRTPSKNSQK
ncbi:MAG: M14 family zinc carboxypeptidase, partial [Armatimonadota bacterium]